MRLAKPWLRKSTGTWHVWLNGKQVYLGKDEDKAHAKYRKLIQSDVAQDLTVRQVIERYWASQKRKAESTKKRRKPILESFSDFVPASLKAEALKPYHLDRWLEDRGKRKVSVKGAGRGKKTQTTKPLSETTERDYITLIAGVFKWAKTKGYVSHNPLAEVEKPAANTRQEFVKFEDWGTLIGLAIGEPFKDYITVMLYTGARATEMLKFEAAHFDKNRLVLPIKSSKGKKRSRVVYLPDAALEIVKRLVKQYPTGKLFRNTDGRGWNKDSIGSRFKRLKRLMKMPTLTPTTLRHSFAHHRLTSGQDSLTVAKLMGHVDTRMIATRYGHLEENATYLRSAANGVSFPDLGAASPDH